MIPLGNSGLPNGYKRLEYIENVIGGDSKSASILTDIYPTQNTRGKLVAEAVSTERVGIVYMAFGCNRTPNAGPQPFGLRWINSRHLNNVYFVINNVPAGNYRISDGIAHTLEFSKESFKIDGVVKYTFGDIGEFKSPNKLIFLAETPSYLTYRCFRGKAYSFKLWENDMPILDFVPALNPSGVPGMFDTVSKTFKKSATSTPFVAGMTLRQVRDINLPVPGTVNKLSLSIPCEVYNDAEAWGAIEAAQQKGWTFTFYWTNVVAYLTPQLNAIVGSGNYTISYNYQTSKLSLTFVLSVTREQVDEVESLLKSVLSSSIVVDMKWSDGLPIDYKHVEYLECLGGDGRQYINTKLHVTQETRVFTTSECTSTSAGSLSFVYGAEGYVNAPVPMALAHYLESNGTKSTLRYFWDNKATVKAHVSGDRKVSVDYSKNGLYVNGQLKATVPYAEFRSNYPLSVFSSVLQSSWAFYGRIYELKIWESEVLMLSFIPVLDPTGAPCMFDTVNRKAYYNAGTGDFIYPGKETEATTYSLRNRMYAQYTEHGIRRLYRVPEGYNSKEEYAAANGFKLLIETPQPEEGYWQPVWHDREDCIELDWVETDPPAELPGVPSEELPE